MIATLPCVSARDSDCHQAAQAIYDDLGLVIITDVYAPSHTAAMRREIEAIEARADKADPSYLTTADGFLWAIWNMGDKSPLLLRMAADPEVFTLVPKFLGEPAEFCRATLMCKSPGTKHAVGWHQDAGLAVTRHVDDGKALGIWAGVPHRVPLQETMARMIAVRVSIDQQHADGGALQVIPGSHRWGLIEQAKLQEMVAAHTPLLCPVPEGAALIYNQLTVHSSGPSTCNDSASRRRVLHHEFIAHSAPAEPGFPCWPWQISYRLDAEGVHFRRRRDTPYVTA